MEQFGLACILFLTRKRIKAFISQITHAGTVEKLELICYLMVFLMLCNLFESAGLGTINIDIMNWVYWGA